MTPQNQVQLIYETLKQALPARIKQQMKFLPVNHLPTKSGTGIRGRMLGNSPQGIWNSNWCFYEIGIGSYRAANEPTFGAIGFVSFPNNKKCGDGMHHRHISQYIINLAGNLQDLVPSNSTDSAQVAFSYYRKKNHPYFPTMQAAADLAVLICTTFDDFNRLKVPRGTSDKSKI